MPLYEYQCKKKHITEQLYSSFNASEEIITCSECKKPATRILSKQADPVFVGEGFYISDKKSRMKYQRDKEKFGKK